MGANNLDVLDSIDTCLGYNLLGRRKLELCDVINFDYLTKTFTNQITSIQR